MYCKGFTKTHTPCKLKCLDNGYCTKHQSLVPIKDKTTYLSVLPRDILNVVHGYLYRENTAFVNELLTSVFLLPNYCSKQTKRKRKFLNEISVKHQLGIHLKEPAREMVYHEYLGEKRQYSVEKIKMEGSLAPVCDEALLDILPLFTSSYGETNGLLQKHNVHYRIIPVRDESNFRIEEYDIIFVKESKRVKKFM